MAPRPAFHPLPLGAVRPLGWLLAQLRRDLEGGFASRLDQLSLHAANDLFRERIPSSDDPRAWWDAETRGNWLWGYVMMAHLAEAPEHQARVAELVAGLLATQDDDGYIGIYAPDARYQHADGENGELWAQSRALLPLIAQFEATGESEVMEALRRAADLTLWHLGVGPPYFRRGDRVHWDEITGLTHGLCYLDVLEWLHANTGHPGVAEAGVRLYDQFSSMPLPFPNDDLALPNLADVRHFFRGHAVHTAEHLRALLWVGQLAPDRVSSDVVDRALRRLEYNCVPSGALMGDETIHGAPMPEAGYEYCTTTELSFSLTSAIQKLGRAELGDRLEKLAFNAAQGARFPDGRAIAYLSADTRISAVAHRLDSYGRGDFGGRHDFSPTHDDVACCCNPNAVRFLPQFISRMWMRVAPEEGFAAIAYGPCRLRGTHAGVGLTIVEETEYPFSDTIEFTVTPERAVEFTLLLRKPGWVGAMNVAVRGAEARLEDGWCRIRKVWSAGDRVRVSFSWTVRSELYANGEVALFRGPLQFALPLDHRLEITRGYGDSGFHDYDVYPEDVAQGYHVPVLSKAPEFGLTVEARPGGDAGHPWDAPQLVLRHGETTLVPIGCTVLRRAAFPIR